MKVIIISLLIVIIIIIIMIIRLISILALVEVLPQGAATRAVVPRLRCRKRARSKRSVAADFSGLRVW